MYTLEILGGIPRSQQIGGYSPLALSNNMIESHPLFFQIKPFFVSHVLANQTEFITNNIFQPFLFFKPCHEG